jgi:uncharacterized protein YjbI with pentapeptide repeats
MKSESPKQLRDRWAGIPLTNIRERLLKVTCGSEFGLTADGLCDYRGIEISESLHKVTVLDTDFSYAVMKRGQLVGNFVRSRFTKSQLETNVALDFDRCDFADANLSECWMRGAFESCSFERTKLDAASITNARLANCTFIGNGLRETTFSECTFEGCSFTDCSFEEGSLVGSTFKNCRFVNVSARDVSMNRVTGFDPTRE